jgi:hypothetical protein
MTRYWHFCPGFKPATFKFPHNWSKSRLLLILYFASRDWSRAWYNSKDLAVLTGLSIASIRCLVGRCSHYEYVNWRGKRDIEYRINAKGKRFVEKAMPDEVKDALVPKLQELVSKNRSLTT